MVIAKINGQVSVSETKDTKRQRLRVNSKAELETSSYLVKASSLESTPRSLSVAAAMIRGTRDPFLK